MDNRTRTSRTTAIAAIALAAGTVGWATGIAQIMIELKPAREAVCD